ncbi:MAG: HlyD family efflux transporter periplasmic adaptor subunit [Acidimicrobiia bacterium]
MVLATINDRPVIAGDLQSPFWRPLRSGDEGPDVLRLQQVLQSEGLLEEVDSSFGIATKAALITWQELRGYSPADGVLMPQDLSPVPTGGVVLEVSVQVGTRVDPGSILYVLGSESHQVVSSVPPGDVSQLSIGDAASILLADGRELSGVITEIGASNEEHAAATNEPSVVRPITIQPSDGRLLTRGENLRVTILISEAEDVPSVPLLAIMTDAKGSPAVRIRAESGAIDVRPVELGLVDAPWVEVLSGVNLGDFVVVGEE